MTTRRRTKTDHASGAEFAEELRALSLVDYIPAVSTHLTRPTHLKRACDMLEGAYRGKVRATIAAPVQHGKTTIVEHAIPYLLNKHLGQPRIIFATYAQRFAESRSRNMRRVYEQGGGLIDSSFNTIQEWHTPAVLAGPKGGIDTSSQGGFVFITSVDGAATGYPAQVVLVDDPFKNREEAENPAHREAVKEWFRSVILTRLSPGASVYIIASRWHEDDLSGWAASELGFDELRIAAVNDDGADPTRPLAPKEWAIEIGRDEWKILAEPECALAPNGPDPDEPRDLTFLAGQRKLVGEYDWESLYQGRPRPRSGAMFKDARFYTNLPEAGLIRREGIGVDLAYSAGARSDWSVLLDVYHARIGRLDADTGAVHMVDALYIHDCVREQKALEEFAPTMDDWWDAHDAKSVPWASYAAGPERAIIRAAHKLTRNRIKILALIARFSKYVRAQQAARTWNDARVFVRAGQPWTEWFVREVCGFTGGPGDAHDDGVDAYVSIHDVLLRNAGEATPGESKRRISFGRRRM